MYKNILVVCSQNIYLSPCVEAILQSKFPQANISSAGMCAFLNKEVDDYVSDILFRLGKTTSHKARQLNDRIIDENDLILIFETAHLNALIKLYPRAQGKVELFGKWNNNQEIIEPLSLKESDIVNSYQQIGYNASLWVNHFNLEYS